MLCSANKTTPLLTYQPLLLAQAQTALLSMASQRMIIVPITTKVVSLNPAHDEVYVLDITLYGRSVGFSGCSVSTTNQTDRTDIY
jgi:hypothetical protein